MGKSKNKRHKRPKFEPTGLPSVKDAEAELDEQASSTSASLSVSSSTSSFSCMAGGERISNTVLGLIEKLQSPTAEDRECACSTIANLVSQPGSIPQFLQAGSVKIMGPLLLDASFAVRTTALGALRNMSLEGGSIVCEKMVEHDVMTPVITLLQQFGSEWKPQPAPGSRGKTDPQTDVLVQLIHLLWNLCESSEIAVKVCNQQNVVRALLPYLQPEEYGYPLSLVAAQCLQTLTDSNQAAAAELAKTDTLHLLTSLLPAKHSNLAQLLLRTLAASTLYNIAGEQLNQASAGLLDQVIALLAEVLKQDIVGYLQEVTTLLQQAAEQVSKGSNGRVVETSKGSNGEVMETAEASAEDPSPAGEKDTPDADANMETNGSENGNTGAKNTAAKKKVHVPTENEIRHRVIDAKLEEAEHLLSAQQLALQLLTNLCCSDNDDEEWEECDSSDASLDDAAAAAAAGDCSMDMAECLNDSLLAALCIPSEVHASFVNHQIVSKVVSKMIVSDEALSPDIMSHNHGQRLMKSLMTTKCSALLCISNIISSMETEALGGTETLHEIWTRLGPLITAKSVLDNAEQLEAVTTALRSTVCKLGQLHSPKLSEVTEGDLLLLFDLGKTCSHPDVRANIVKIVATIGCELALKNPPLPLLKPTGEFLLAVVEQDTELWVVGEALDSMFDVFAEDHTDSVLKNIDLIPRLRALTPALKTKIHQQKHQLGEHLPIISTARTNLARFIKYKAARIQ